MVWINIDLDIENIKLFNIYRKRTNLATVSDKEGETDLFLSSNLF